MVCHVIGCDSAVPLDVEMRRPAEGEIIAAKRLLERVLLDEGRCFDAVVGDALYLEAPLFHFCIDHGKHVVAVIKGDGLGDEWHLRVRLSTHHAPSLDKGG